MVRLLRLLVALLGCLHLCGGHWGVLQTIAWSRMLVDYSAEHGLLEGARQTFDGRHPCCMCESIDKGRKQETERSGDSKLPSSSALVLKEVVPPRPIVLPAVPACEWTPHRLATVVTRGPSRSTRPPLPPPRLTPCSAAIA